ncbi:dihydro-6-hydroxymethylpterin pyrophosphokinase [Cavenderia fasciculata]|uniref:Dihydro-6-hydroxymethylpterin pyrophosphokinase n=1 Tax=Cavenderia fasciculata TaxID=261658 RepID=F4Q4S4_CACFS|nr:dihydro-6-hydroxymethylpterin pyrophosphokinase [Cavenderia fasciculata]EGG17870.1 dihydro-6-hydroxymethylpterin pyrophosphokinase [Cavenderia fasciculata]|eukprot:XP_004356354.1 dihydro-6-hydroxymethylpterin pyrophosphokinase [Cavenderia fasciculata]
MDTIILKDLHVQAVIGVNASERNIKQNLLFTIKIFKDLSECGSSDLVHHTINYSTLSKSIIAYIESSQHFTLEALATGVARTCCLGFGVEVVKVQVQKPGAIKLAAWPGVKICRTLDFFKNNPIVENPTIITSSLGNANGTPNTSYIAIGSNLGDKFQNINKALELIQSFSKLVSTSFMYEAPPAYFLDQPSFFNCCCKITTQLNPHDLLSRLKEIEKKMGRAETFRNGPRVIDLDIIYYNDIVLKSDTLEIPHKLMYERDFVLLPLSDIAPDFIHPTLYITTNQMKINLKTDDNGSKIKKVIKVGNGTWELGKRTYIMGILNITPDSFADGGKYNQNEEVAFTQFEKLVKEGAHIVDIGGQSTYPGAEQLTVAVELERVLPVIKRIRKGYPDFPLSIDTYHSQVASQAVKAGCNIINDVTGGLRDPNIIKVARELGVPIILNHDQATPQYLLKQSGASEDTINSNYPDIIDIVQRFFKERVNTAVASGLYRWQIILDPGLGFAKTYDQSIEILKRGKELVRLNFPILIGPSRKGFIGATIAKAESSTEIPDPKSSRRLWGTAACCCIAAGWGCDIIRIHDVSEIKDTIIISDTVYRQ